jgi:tRNA nucleotidyltransferase (CCA-adding enzyme)
MWYIFAQKSNILNIPIPEVLEKILLEIQKQNGTGYLVGGIVRDSLFNEIHKTNFKPKDYDVEVFRLPYEKLIEILSKFGNVSEVGKSFGVIKLNAGGEDYDFSLPRTESKSGHKHQDFAVTSNPNLSEKDAASRRDVTINSILFDPLTNNLIDNYNGVDDIKNKVLKHTSDAFSEDPLRVLRLLSLGSRFGLSLAPETAELAQSIREEYKHLPKERVYEEFKKLVTKGIEPGKALDFLYTTGWSENFPEIHNLRGTPQEPEWHPEGDVDVHTAYVMNEAANIAERENLSPEDREVLIYAALAHDFAKPDTTAVINKKGIDRITSHGHEEQGGPKARAFLESIGAPKNIIDKVVPLVEFHLSHIHHSNTPKQEAFVKSLAEKIHPANIRMLELLIEADHSGRPPLPKELPAEARQMSDLAKQYNVYEHKHPDLLQGRDIMPYLGNKGGPIIGEILKEHRKLILEHNPAMESRESALAWLHKRMQRIASFIDGNDVQQVLGIQGPAIKLMLDEAWKAQNMGLFNDKAGALQWLESQKETT